MLTQYPRATNMSAAGVNLGLTTNYLLRVTNVSGAAIKISVAIVCAALVPGQSWLSLVVALAYVGYCTADSKTIDSTVLGIGQIILEGVGGKQWVHVSTHTPEREINRVITVTDAGTVPGIAGLA